MKNIGIVGAGNMGSGIAQKYATAKCNVTLVDLDESSLNNGRAKIEATLEEGVQRKLFSAEKKNAILSHISFTTKLEALENCELVIEAIFEDKDTKTKLFQRLDKTCSANTVFATNTSSFYVDDFALKTNRPELFVGLHYFYHPAKNKLVEVIKGTKTSSETFDTVWALQENIGKIPVQSTDSPGFIVNRFFVPWLNEAMRVVHENKANIPTVEAAAKKTFQIRMGPFELMNVTGLPIAFNSAKTLATELGAFYAPCPLIEPVLQQKKQWELTGEVDEKKLAYVSSRLLSTVFFVATQMVLGEEVCSKEDCDLGARVGLRWKKGPFELMGEKTPRFIDISIENRVGFLTFNRPDAMNALSPKLLEQFKVAFNALERSSEVEKIVLQGKGKAFMAGADLQFFSDNLKQNTFKNIADFTKDAQDLFYQVDTCKKTVVCFLNGIALGGGLELALCCDEIVATPSARLGFPETGIGIYPGLGGTQRTPKKVGQSLARWLVLSGTILDGKKAFEIGLVDRLVDSFEAFLRSLRTKPTNAKKDLKQTSSVWNDTILLYEKSLPELLELDDKLQQKGQLALRLADQLIRQAQSWTIEEGLKNEASYLEKVFKSPDTVSRLLVL